MEFYDESIHCSPSPWFSFIGNHIFFLTSHHCMFYKNPILGDVSHISSGLTHMSDSSHFDLES